MKPLRTIFAALMLVAAAFAPTVGAAAPVPAVAPAVKTARVSGEVVNVVDGDTLDVALKMSIRVLNEQGKWVGCTGTRVVRIRLLADYEGRGCWAPESKTKDLAVKSKGLASKGHLIDIALGKKVVVVLPLVSDALIDYLSLERVLAVVERGGKSLGELQIQAKYASSTKGGVLGT